MCYANLIVRACVSAGDREGLGGEATLLSLLPYVDVIRVNTCRTSSGTFGVSHSIARRRGSWAMCGAYECARTTRMHPPLPTNGRRLGGVAKSLTAVLRTI